MSLHVGYVISNEGEIYVQVPADNPQGWVICDDDQSWELPPFASWEAIRDDDPRITDADREKLQWIIDESRP